MAFEKGCASLDLEAHLEVLFFEPLPLISKAVDAFAVNCCS
jgi:hypothetical protein